MNADEIAAIRNDYQQILALCARKRKVLDRIERNTTRNLKRINRLLRRWRRAIQEQNDGADWWRNGPAEGDGESSTL